MLAKAQEEARQKSVADSLKNAHIIAKQQADLKTALAAKELASKDSLRRVEETKAKLLAAQQVKEEAARLTLENQKRAEEIEKIAAENKAKEQEHQKTIADSLQKVEQNRQLIIQNNKALLVAKQQALSDSLAKIDSIKRIQQAIQLTKDEAQKKQLQDSVKKADEQRQIALADERKKKEEELRKDAQDRKLKQLELLVHSSQLKEAKDQIDEVEKMNLSKIYSNNRTEEYYERPRVKVTRVIYNSHGIITVFTKAVHAFGETYYFEDNQSISETFYNIETSK